MIINTSTTRQMDKTNSVSKKNIKTLKERGSEIEQKDLVNISVLPEKSNLPKEQSSPEVISPEKSSETTTSAVMKDKTSGNLMAGPAAGTFAQFDETNDIAGINKIGDKAPGKKDLTSRESKMLLKPECFENPKEGMLKFWEDVKKAAVKEGCKVEDISSPEMEDPRYVTYLDTPDFSLNKLGYIIRRRQATEFKGSDDKSAITGDSKSNPDLDTGTDRVDRGKKYELTFKFRNSDMSVSASKDISLAEGLEGKSKFEEDVVAGTDSMRRIYSPSVKTELKHKTGNTLGDYAEIFPPLLKLGLSPDTELEQVNDRKIEEDKMDLGTITFPNGISATASIGLWYNQGNTDKPIIGEFSFAYKVNKGDNTVNYSDAIIKDLQKSSSPWIADGVTKTELIYGHKEGDDL